MNLALNEKAATINPQQTPYFFFFLLQLRPGVSMIAVDRGSVMVRKARGVVAGDVAGL